MKKVILVLMLSPLFCLANTTNDQLLAIKDNLEVKGFISTFEKNRSQKCNEISAESIRIKKSGWVDVRITCNEYDQNGEPQANVYGIDFGGYIYGTFFDLQKVKVTGYE
ncbi:hypothetical protein [Bdellovibrio sp. HCB337]|uniref:hypothetical protein n=1 Tax=Bdellovibrio sp. HCB337 TaxID=3394358 RepID=UPI0039A4AB92